ncbi:MAG: glycoside hydrolase family 97 N-terminal domain-containing protein [Saprospiraceae bacterium]|nr:glycoside hydrolase family 97 N-terminal domain-containing protein [Saprospiraceae bacterium]
MKKILLCALLALLSVNISAQTIQSPSGKLSLTFALTSNGEPTYNLLFGNKPIIQTSKLGLELKDAPAFMNGFSISRIDSNLIDETWEPVWGELKTIRNHYRELAITLQQTAIGNRQLVIRFRVFDDGLGFRYEFPKQDQLNYFIVTNENTEFHLTGDHKAFWIPGDYDTNEYSYSTTKLSEINAFRGRSANEISTRTIIAENAVQTPLMIKSTDGIYSNIHEAALVNYPAMHLMIDKNNFKLTSHLVPSAVGDKAFLQTPFHTPWRTIVISDKATDILASKLILNLNEPSKIADAN